MPFLANHYVYHLYDNGALAYVGRSVAPKSRWRAHNKKHGKVFELKIVLGPTEFELAQSKELEDIRQLKPKLNVYIASSPARLGKTNSAAHNKAVGAVGRVGRREAALLGWETRARDQGPMKNKHHTVATKARLSLTSKVWHETHKNPFKGRKHSPETIARLREVALWQAEIKRQFI